MKKKTTRQLICISIISILLLLLVSACDMEVSNRQQEEQYTEQQMLEAQRQIGQPFIDDYFEKRLAKQIFELRDDSNLVTYAYMTNLDGQFIYLGQAIGFGLPYSVQYTNPEQIIDRYEGDMAIPQADPNGLYMPDGLSATWLLLINEETGEPEIIYTEPSIVVTQSKLPKRLIAPWSLPVNY